MRRLLLSTMILHFTAATAFADGCDPNYANKCVPIASDVDCASGSGNGPAYVDGPVYVVGSDIYDLDRDGDGVACER
jgi:resuscitation-promoting factor RpfB